MNYDVVAWLIPLDDGLKKNHIQKIIEMLPDADILPFEIHENNSSVYGFATIEVAEEENGLESIIDLLTPVIEDWTNESSDYTHTLSSGKKVYMGCDCRTIIVEITKNNK
ncbi:MAG: hypothetical protein WCR27_06530 [Eubacteriales bacterium]